MAKTKKYLPFPLFLLIAGIVGVSTWIAIKSLLPLAEPLEINQVVESGHVSLSLQGNLDGAGLATPKYYPNTSTYLTLFIDTNTVKATGAVVDISYDNTYLEVSSVENSGFLPITLAKPIIANGKISFTFASTPDSGGVQGVGNLAKINVKPLKLGTTTLSFREPTVVSVVGKDSNDLKSVSDYSLYIGILTDLNSDKTVNIYDYNLFVADYGKSAHPIYRPSDFNKSGTVDIFDYNLFVADYGKTSP